VDKSDIQETLVSLYLRLNGYFVSGFIIHASRGVGTEMDVLAIRFPQHKEPMREIQPCDHLSIPAERIDFIVGEVKGGLNNVNFNTRFRDDSNAIRSVLQRFGAFADAEIDRICAIVPAILKPIKLKRSTSFPELDVVVCEAVGMQKGKLRFVPFAAEQRRSSQTVRPYIFQNDLLRFVWRCFRPEKHRQECDVRYNFELWGPQFLELVNYFKDVSRTEPGTIEDIYQAYGVSTHVS
jgi:hypothetical protein